MARYVAKMRTPRSPTEVFDYMADFRNVAAWDPSIRRVDQVVGTGGSSDAEFDVTISNPGRDMLLRYRTVEYDAPHGLRLVARNRWFTSDDRITVTPDEGDGDGSILVYDARLTLSGPLGLADPLLGFAFNRVADRAVSGLHRALDGVPVT
jgi:hypothetical protein